ncbi:hypothetical protein ACFQX6_23430 [Streptosporangium lutulentum]
MHAILNDEPEPPARAGRLAPVLEGLLRKDPALRMNYAEAEGLLRAVAEGEEKPEKPARKRPAKTAVMPAVVAASATADTDPGARFQADDFPATGAKLGVAVPAPRSPRLRGKNRGSPPRRRRSRRRWPRTRGGSPRRSGTPPRPHGRRPSHPNGRRPPRRYSRVPSPHPGPSPPRHGWPPLPEAGRTPSLPSGSPSRPHGPSPPPARPRGSSPRFTRTARGPWTPPPR